MWILQLNTVHQALLWQAVAKWTCVGFGQHQYPSFPTCLEWNIQAMALTTIDLRVLMMLCAVAEGHFLRANIEHTIITSEWCFLP